MTQSNSDFVTDDQFPILRVQTFQRSVSVVVWLEPLETENIGATLSRHPGHPGSPVALLALLTMHQNTIQVSRSKI